MSVDPLFTNRDHRLGNVALKSRWIKYYVTLGKVTLERINEKSNIIYHVSLIQVAGTCQNYFKTQGSYTYIYI